MCWWDAVGEKHDNILQQELFPLIDVIASLKFFAERIITLKGVPFLRVVFALVSIGSSVHIHFCESLSSKILHIIDSIFNFN